MNKRGSHSFFVNEAQKRKIDEILKDQAGLSYYFDQAADLICGATIAETIL